ncbi:MULTISPECIES: hypothetical protein [Thermocrispum]|uniref:hypothetical protein n=1 Tax=Thermocrispum TaxID=37924 RepID=UPI00048C4162|nr:MULTISPECIES: hypothetical protein [Thermocrispum]
MPFGTVLFALYPTLGIVLLLLTLVELAIRLVVMVVLAVLLGCELLVQWIVGAIRRRSPGKQGRVDVIRPCRKTSTSTRLPW